MENQEEIWKDIEGYEGHYQVSDSGRAKSLKFGKERILKLCVNTAGYYQVILCNGTKKGKVIHRLVAKAFIPNPENKRTINHKWGDKKDNRAVALEWATYSENHLHAYRELGKKPTWIDNYGKDHNRSKSVAQYSKDGEFIQSFDCQTDAAKKTGISQGSISLACSGRQKITCGYFWKRT